MMDDTQKNNNMNSLSEEQTSKKTTDEVINTQKESARDKILDILIRPVVWGLSATIPFLVSAYLNNRPSSSNQTEELWKRIEQISKKTDQVINQTKKDTVPADVPYFAPTIPDSIALLHTRMATTNINEIILKKGGLNKIPHVISYTVGGHKKHIDITQYLDSLETDTLFFLQYFNGDFTAVSNSVSGYCAKDYYKYKPLLQKISSEWVGITTKDSYRDKVAKIQKFVNSFPYEYDMVYLGKKGLLPVSSDYQLPMLANLLIGKMDCNNKAGLFIELCRVNNIISGMGVNPHHASPAVFSDSKDEIRKYTKSNLSIPKKGGGCYNGIVVDPTGGIIIGKETRAPLPGNVSNYEAYADMEFTIFRPK